MDLLPKHYDILTKLKNGIAHSELPRTRDEFRPWRFLKENRLIYYQVSDDGMFFNGPGLTEQGEILLHKKKEQKQTLPSDLSQVRILLEKLLELKDLRHNNKKYSFWVKRIESCLNAGGFEDTAKSVKEIWYPSFAVIGGDYTEAREQQEYIEKIEESKELLEAFLEDQEDSTLNTQAPSSLPRANFGLGEYDLHPLIQKHCLKLHTDGYYKEAIQAAMVEVINYVKTKTNNLADKNGKKLDGLPLMNQAFSDKEGAPLINFSGDLGIPANKDEHDGFAFIFKGLCGLRNKKAHMNYIQKDPKRAIEYLVFCSMLMRLLDDFS